jgi:UDPglucose 6-dehydrogenase
MSIESAELTKVAYNTFIGFKIVFANALAEIVDARGGNVDEVTYALSKASHRLMSPKYLSAGMGDGGGCHPRDQIAMSWLAEDSDLSIDLFEFIAHARDKQTERQAEIIRPFILGKAYKENSPLTVGSPALLLEYFLTAKSINYESYDPWVDPEMKLPVEPRVYFIATKHKVFEEFRFASGSIVIDPWGYIEKQPGVTLVKPGRNSN